MWNHKRVYRIYREALEQIIEWRGKPLAIRCDSGPEYLSEVITQWTARHGIALNYIQLGKLQQNAYVERFNRTVRYEWLSQYYWDDFDHVQQFATQWVWKCNHERPNLGPGGITPASRSINSHSALLQKRCDCRGTYLRLSD